MNLVPRTPGADLRLCLLRISSARPSSRRILAIVTMKYDHPIVKSVYAAARRRLCTVDTLADAVLLAASTSEDPFACSQVARLGFEALTGGCSMNGLEFDPTYFMKDSPDGAGGVVAADQAKGFAAACSLVDAAEDEKIPPNPIHPSVTYINLTGISDNFASEDGHRFLLVQCHGRVRVLQACKGTYG